LGVEGREGDRRRLSAYVNSARVAGTQRTGFSPLHPGAATRSQEELEEVTMASRNLARDESREHHDAKVRLEDARESRDAIQDEQEAARRLGRDDFEQSVALRAAHEQVAAREAWRKWIERDY
jgi:hypothetical protein